MRHFKDFLDYFILILWFLSFTLPKGNDVDSQLFHEMPTPKWFQLLLFRDTINLAKVKTHTSYRSKLKSLTYHWSHFHFRPPWMEIWGQASLNFRFPTICLESETPFSCSPASEVQRELPVGKDGGRREGGEDEAGAGRGGVGKSPMAERSTFAAFATSPPPLSVPSSKVH